MREDNPNITVMEIAEENEMIHISYRTLVRTLNNAGYWCLRPRRRGILSAKEKKIRVLYARNALRKHEKSFWVEDMLMYLDGASRCSYTWTGCPEAEKYTKMDGSYFA